MRHYSFNRLALANYKDAEVGVSGGSRPRIVLTHKKNNQRFFLKTYRHTPREIWSEMFASQIGSAAGFNVQMVSLKQFPEEAVHIFEKEFQGYLPPRWKPVGALVRHAFPRGHEILYGAQIIGSENSPVKLEEIEEKIRARYRDSEDILQDIADMIVFDAWIGNMDRHHENWAIGQKDMMAQLALLPLSREEREENKKRRKFTPLFDHGSSLLFELGEDKVDQYYENRIFFEESYILSKPYGFILSEKGEKKNIFSILSDHYNAKTPWKKRFEKSIKKVKAMEDLLIARMILEMPTDGLLEYSQKRKELLYYSLRRRKELLNELNQQAQQKALYPKK